MLLSQTNIDILLEEWDTVKHKKCPSADNILDVSNYMHRKAEIEYYVTGIRYARLTNNLKEESQANQKFIETYTKFNEDFVYRILKNDRTT